MNQTEFVVLVPGGDHHTVGLVELEVIPRVGECVFYDRTGTEEDMIFTVKDVIHRVVPKGPTIVMMKSIEDRQ